MRREWKSSGTLVAILLVPGGAGSQEPADGPRRQLLREHALQERALRQYLGHDVLLSESVGIEGQDLQQAVVPSPTRGDVDIAGFVFKGGVPFVHNQLAGNTAVGLAALSSVTPGTFPTTGQANTALGKEALLSNTTGAGNTGLGYRALYRNSTGLENTAVGNYALFGPDAGVATGTRNTATGFSSLTYLTTGYANTAVGWDALFFNSSGADNTALGYDALSSNTDGDRNIAIGAGAGSETTGNDNILLGNAGSAGESGTLRIGTAGSQLQTFIAGIRDVAVGSGDPVLIDGSGQLGTIDASSRKLKQDVEEMAEASDTLLALRPVTFRFRQDVARGNRKLHYGLIAEEVAEIDPELVAYSRSGEILGVRYHVLAPMLLNELQKQHRRLGQQERHLTEQRRRLMELVSRQQREIEWLRTRLEALETSLETPGRMAARPVE